MINKTQKQWEVEWEKEWKEKTETGRKNAMDEADNFIENYSSGSSSRKLKLEDIIDFVQKFIKALPEGDRAKIIPDGVCKECLHDTPTGTCWNCYESRCDYD